ncbi:RAMP superfamily CRISPR-associated protein [Limnoraphis robusta]|uniref:CRISPR type III-associated protein domain-containing protein n=1 Tax=Limnoraphis robusta CS-951 TaxID=1637645 RepID=A0A0F5YI06_9CYAN|nr:RAMP superfamily CRISPR-associated protein [Limnoraphis robusta]KKD37830.1 hypothetical protein WN50_12015 [Limnoraphis robusta CS-951]
MLPLPEDMPKWYTVNCDKPEEEKGWTPKTEDIVQKPNSNKEIINAWNGTVEPRNGKQYTVRVDKLEVLSPIQVGGYIFSEGGILPAQVGGVPYIPGSSIRGAFLKWIKTNLPNLEASEQQFWLSLLKPDKTGWQPRKIRFESVLLKDLKPFPLYAQQEWQVFNEKSNKLSVQWQVAPKHPPKPTPGNKSLQVLLKEGATSQQKEWLKTQLKQMLEKRGIGRGTASGFGRLGTSIPSGKWQIKLTGMKPCVQQYNNNPNKPEKNQNGIYRWTPQVLRANLRGYFTRLALSLLSRQNAIALTNKVFGGLTSPAQLQLTSYLGQVKSPFKLQNQDYANIKAKDAHETWVINVDCNSSFDDLIGGLLDLSSRLGGLGPGWRRPPHKLKRFNGFRGSEFEVSPVASSGVFEENPGQYLQSLIELLQEIIRQQAERAGLQFSNNTTVGKIVSIWQGEPTLWEEIVHKVCSTNAKDKPSWCGVIDDEDSKKKGKKPRPSGYAVRQYESFCLLTVFDPNVEETLRQKHFTRIWPSQ